MAAKAKKMPESKITNIQGAGDWVSSHGEQMFKFEYTFEDGTVLMANHKSNPSPFSVGQVALYELRNEYKGVKNGSVKKPDQGGVPFTPRTQAKAGDPSRQQSIERQCALKAAVQLHQGASTDIDEVLTTATAFYAWLQL